MKINYSLFKQRRKFNPLILFRHNKDTSYEDFVSYLSKFNVESPGIEYFESVKKKFIEESEKVLNKKTEKSLKEEIKDCKEENKDQRPEITVNKKIKSKRKNTKDEDQHEN